MVVEPLVSLKAKVAFERSLYLPSGGTEGDCLPFFGLLQLCQQLMPQPLLQPGFNLRLFLLSRRTPSVQPLYLLALLLGVEFQGDETVFESARRRPT